MSSRVVAHAVIVVSIGLGACRDPDLDRLGAIKDQVCACHTGECADKAVKQVAEHPIAPNRRTQKLAREMLECVAKAHEDERPADDETPVTGSN